MRFILTVLSIGSMGLLQCLDGIDGGGIVCTEIFVYGVNVTLTEASTGQPISGATLTLVEGDHSEELEELNAGSYAGAGERPGTYTLTVEADGFQSKTKEDIFVDADECHVIPVALEIQLDPS